ncbi:Ribonuclease 3 [subsurface metagenome]
MITHDSKSQLQHLIQAKQQQPPTYRVIKAEGPDHNRTFTVEVSAGDIVLGKGTGKSKKSAETDAARSALKRLPSSFTG